MGVAALYNVKMDIEQMHRKTCKVKVIYFANTNCTCNDTKLLELMQTIIYYHAILFNLINTSSTSFLTDLNEL